MEDEAVPLAVPLFDTLQENESSTKSTQVSNTGESVKSLATRDEDHGNVGEQAESVGITMITGYLGAGKTTVSGINHRLVCKLSEDLTFSFLFPFNEIFSCKLNC